MTEGYGPRVALLVIDIQNDFASPGGSLYVAGGESIIPAVNDEIGRAAAAGSPVVYTQDWHPPTTPHFSTSGGLWPPHCVRETVGAALHPELRVQGTVVRKGTGGEDGYSGFTVRDPLTGDPHATGLLDVLAAHRIDTVVVVGLAGDHCVKATALDGRALGYGVVVPLALTRFVMLQPGDDERAVAQLREAGVTVVPERSPGP
ncbi:isochorismatase family protein [Frankia sp. Cppng1_Ct_nod]|uniref:isochorismatase family protein n=1 Tax=Frankia sp. Cppng1_Ct_nod TaxID=2897162 RepID=UPI002024E048|nr:isochorismatase family protein [Frankia sp. Cppng1_Ct_nod]